MCMLLFVRVHACKYVYKCILQFPKLLLTLNTNLPSPCCPVIWWNIKILLACVCYRTTKGHACMYIKLKIKTMITKGNTVGAVSYAS